MPFKKVFIESIRDNCTLGLQGVGGQKVTECPRFASGELDLDPLGEQERDLSP